MTRDVFGLVHEPHAMEGGASNPRHSLLVLCRLRWTPKTGQVAKLQSGS